MAARFKEKKITRYRLQIELQNKDTIQIILDCGSITGTWVATLPDNKDFYIQEVIDICQAIYDAEVFSDDYDFFLECKNWPDRVIIRGKEKIAHSILSQVKIPFVKKES